MPAVSASASGKIIIFGEHAVVFGKPAIAVPVSEVWARAVVMAEPLFASGVVKLIAPDIDLEASLDDLPAEHPLAAALRLTQAAIGLTRAPACSVRITSTIPIAAGLGSGSAVSVALIRAFSAFHGCPFSDEKVSDLAFEVDRLHHGTPSGIDNSVIAHKLPVYYVRDQRIEVLKLPVPFRIVIGDTGVRSSTGAVVGDLRQAWLANRSRTDKLFDQVGSVAEQARELIETGFPWKLGQLFDENHALLCELGVSSPELDLLVAAARNAGALGAKLSGGGRGGNMIALVEADSEDKIIQALVGAGAVRTIATTIRTSGSN